MASAIATHSKHLAVMIGIITILSFLIVYPFIPGDYDRLAMPFSILIQFFGAAGLLLSIIGLLWIAIPEKGSAFLTISLYLSTFIFILLTRLSFFICGKVLSIFILVLWVLLFIQLRTKIKHSKTTDQSKFKFIPIYLVVIPVALLIIQLTLAKSFTDRSRNRAIINAAHYINDITSFYEKHGHYPESLQAVHFDYYPQITGIEKYYYLPFRDSYNLSFEQPRFLFDKIGTREWVVYNPKDEHRVYSHTSVLLLLSPDELERSQGWYASGNSTHAHWKYFLFD